MSVIVIIRKKKLWTWLYPIQKYSKMRLDLFENTLSLEMTRQTDTKSFGCKWHWTHLLRFVTEPMSSEAP